MGRKLDTLTTDYDSLRTALINILQDFNLIKDLYKSSTGVIIIEQLSYVVELLNFYINEVKNEMSVGDAQKRATLIDLARSFGYDLFYGAPARGNVYITYSLADYSGGPGNNINIPSFTYIQSKGGVNYMTIEEYNFTETSGSGYLRVRQGLLRQAILGTSDGTPFQKFKIPSRFVTIPTEYDEPLINVVFEASITNPATNKAVPWEYVDSLISSTDESEHFTIELDEDNFVLIKFGDDIFGKIPEPGSEIVINYEEHVGSYGNIDGNDIKDGSFNTNSQALYNTTQLVEVVSMSAENYVNGRDPDDNLTLRENIPSFTRIQARSVVPEDFENAWELHKGVIRSQVLGFNDFYSIVSRNYTLTGTANDVSNFIAASSFHDLSAKYDRPWQYIVGSGALSGTDTSAMASAFYDNAISGFGITQTDVWAYNAMGPSLVYQPDYHLYVCGAVGSGAPTAASFTSGWFSKVVWSDDVAGASSVGHSGGAISQNLIVTPLKNWIDDIAQPMININFQQKAPTWVWTNLSISLEKDPKSNLADSAIIDSVKTLMWEDWGFKATCDFDNSKRVDFGKKIYLNRIENDILNNVDGIISTTLAGEPNYLLPATAEPGAGGEPTGIVTGGAGLWMWTPGPSGTMNEVAAQEYKGNWPSTAVSALTSAACYTSGYGVFWNPEERSLKFKENQIPIFNVSAINFT